jgi:hypothetical protein
LTLELTLELTLQVPEYQFLAHLTMPSKGLQLYSYIAVPGARIEFLVPGQTLVKTDIRVFSNDHLEIDKKNLQGLFNYSGEFQFQVYSSTNQLVTSQWVSVNVLTGNLEGGSMKSMEDQLSFISPDIIVTYCFYNAGQSGTAGLPTSNQCLVTVSPNYADWMGQVAAPASPQAAKSFTRFFLPAAHDIGMNSMQNVDVVLQTAGKAFIQALELSDSVFAEIAEKLSQDVIQGMAPNIISGLAITQKDNLADILTIGARYFEFRPAHLLSAIKTVTTLPDKLYFQHGPIPGMAYDQFLSQVVDFLLSHAAEIVVVQLRWDGVPAECARPSDQELAESLSTALQSSEGAIVAGSVDDLPLTVDSLRSQGKRLIMLENVNSYSTYSDQANATLDGDSIIAEFEKASTALQAGNVLTNFQCQATATNIKDVVIYSVLTANVSNSCLLATKGVCDNKTLPWIRANVLGRLEASEPVLVMNDFFDGATADVAVQLAAARFGN